MKVPLPEGRRISPRAPAASSYHCRKACHSVGLSRRFVDPYPADPRESHRQAGLVPAALVDRIEGDLEHQALFDLAHRPEPLDRMAADPAVEPLELLIGEAEISLADRRQFAFFRPAAESVVAVIAGAFARAALRV